MLGLQVFDAIVGRKWSDEVFSEGTEAEIVRNDDENIGSVCGEQSRG